MNAKPYGEIICLHEILMTFPIDGIEFEEFEYVECLFCGYSGSWLKDENLQREI